MLVTRIVLVTLFVFACVDETAHFDQMQAILNRLWRYVSMPEYPSEQKAIHFWASCVFLVLGIAIVDDE